MKLVVLGPNGMLGSMVLFVAKQRTIDFQSIARAQFDVLEQDLEHLSTIIKKDDKNPICIVNCIGCIPQRQYTEEEYVRINQEFPHELARFCQANQYGLVHISTNCVFRGDEAKYTENDRWNAEDLYGQTKARGEPSYGLVIRSSIIGPERLSSSGLLSWFLTNPSKQVNGYLHQYWNGVTSFELATYILDSLLEKAWSSILLHVYSSRTLSKYQLLQITKQIFQKEIMIVPYECPVRHYTLGSINSVARKDIEEQLHDLFNLYHDFMSNM